MECPTCGQPCSRQIHDALDNSAMDVIALFSRQGVHITSSEARLLTVLKGRNRPIQKGLIMEAVYGWRPDADYPSEKIIDVFVCKLRGKIKKAKLPWSIVTHWGIGYELDEGNTNKFLKRMTCVLMILLPLGQVILSRLP